MSELHWATPYIGLPYVPGRSDCWSFARRVWAERFGLDVPALEVDPQDPRAGRRALAIDPAEAGWLQVDRPAEGDAVMMATGRRPCHVGLWIEPESGAGILHSVEGAGVIFTPADHLGGIGYSIVGFWRWQA